MAAAEGAAGWGRGAGWAAVEGRPGWGGGGRIGVGVGGCCRPFNGPQLTMYSALYKYIYIYYKRFRNVIFTT